MYEWVSLYARQRIDELHQDREKLRIVREALQAGGVRDPFYAPLLARVGRQLSMWGGRLQARYAETPERVTVQ